MEMNDSCLVEGCIGLSIGTFILKPLHGQKKAFSPSPSQVVNPFVTVPKHQENVDTARPV